MYTEAGKCRLCGNTNLVTILDLGRQYLTGVFPKHRDEQLTSGPLELVKCDGGPAVCNLVQLRHSYNLEEMYGMNYGYRSGLNQSMVNHLHKKAITIQNRYDLKKGDLVVDIGSNDSTLLQGYCNDEYDLVGVDPTGIKFKDFYPPYIRLIPDFFSAKVLKDHVGTKKARVITSISMFYDLESPLDFVHEVAELLADDGVWVFEQSYMPVMLKMNAYDTVCHEHLEYYGLHQIKWMMDRAGLKILDVEFNDVNGGSFSVTCAKQSARYPESVTLINNVLRKEDESRLVELQPYEDFRQRVYRHREEFADIMHRMSSEGRKLLGYGASTKGNVILQFCGISAKEMPFIAEVNEDKFGRFTPGTWIPIISEKEARELKPDFFMVLPWHFRQTIIGRESAYLEKGGRLVFPLPDIEMYPR